MKSEIFKTLSKYLHRPEVKILSAQCYFSYDQKLNKAFCIAPEKHIIFGPLCLSEKPEAAFYIRHALELSALSHKAVLGRVQALKIALVAARNTALFWFLDHTGQDSHPIEWAKPYAATRPPTRSMLKQQIPGWNFLYNGAPLDADLSEAEWGSLLAWLERVWLRIGPVEVLMAEGGDGRLLVNPQTGLNHYGCSHRPRPWAVTFASSTASSLSERGFAAGEHMRLGLMKAIIEEKDTQFLNINIKNIRFFLKDFFGLQPDQDVVLSPSGTDSALFTLALTSLLQKPVTTILTAPDETGSGIPLAAEGRHFAQETACGVKVEKGALIDGFSPETQCLVLPLRNEEGGIIPAQQVVRSCQVMVAEAIAQGKHVLLHVLDLSKTGLLAPDMDAMAALAKAYPDQLDIVVDVCQVRLMPERIQAYLANNWAVMITGSKFYTGPPFCGALLLPQKWRKRLEKGQLPKGLSVYACQSEWPQAPACTQLAHTYNHGLLLRWAAARAEMEAFAAVPTPAVHKRLHQFLYAVTNTILLNPDLQLVAPFVPQRPPLVQDWDRQQTILSFMVRAPEAKDTDTPLDFQRCRQVYQWLNADLSPYVPAAEKALAALLCHIGQPVALPHPHARNGVAAALRLSAGARLISGEPSHKNLAIEARMAREITDAQMVLKKISLILTYWPVLAQADPLPSYMPLSGYDEDSTSLDAVHISLVQSGGSMLSSLAIDPS